MESTGLSRDTKDAFFTLPSVALSCIYHFQDSIQPSKDNVIIEPSAGAGAFSSPLFRTFSRVYAFDIDPQAPGIWKQDFLRFPETNLFQELCSHPIHVIGNPPFGRQAKLARAFIRTCSSFALSISFILPKSFKKETFQNTFPSCFHLLFEMDLPENSFLIGDKPHHVPCVFQIWKKQSSERVKNPRLLPLGFVFCKKNEHPDLAVRRVGVNAGRVVEDNLDGLSEQTHYFLRLTGQNTDLLRTKLRQMRFEHDNTVGPRSISQQELLAKLM